MQRSQPTGRGSNERNSEYERGYAAGFEAGQRTVREQGTYQQPNNRMQGQPINSGFGGNRRSQSRDYEGIKSLPKTDRTMIEQRLNEVNQPADFTNGFQSRRSLDNPANMRNNQPANREHEMAGKVTNPDNKVQFSARGRY